MRMLPRRHSRSSTRPARRLATASVAAMVESLESRMLLSAAAVGPIRPTFVVYKPTGSAIPMGAAPTGITPANMRAAYGINLTTFGTVVGDGAGETIAIVDAYNNPTIATDLAAFDAEFNLPAPPSFTQISQTGTAVLPPPDMPGGWGIETALDVEWSHVIAPEANIVLVEATAATTVDLFMAVNTAETYPGVSVVSMSWGQDESMADVALDANFLTPGVTFVASAGDAGSYSGNLSDFGVQTVSYPAASPDVLSVGGTRLTIASKGAYVSEIGWGSGTGSQFDGGSGGGVSQIEPQPAYQTSVVTQSATQLCVPDVAMDADPATGVPVYSAYDNGVATPWMQVGGTSLAAPMWAGIIAITNQGLATEGLPPLNTSANDQTLPAIYSLPQSDFHDILFGNNGGYNCGPGYDCVTGRGTPIANKLIHDLCIDSSSISGTVYNDANANGVADININGVPGNGETGLAGVLVYLGTNNDGKLDSGDPTTLTDANGNFTFTGLTVGTYQIGEVVPGHYVNETASALGTISVTVTAGEADTGENFLDAPVIGATAQSVYRLYSPVTKEHLYTSDINEYTTLGQNGWNQEGVAFENFNALTTFNGVSDEPLYRLYNAASRQHLWTTDLNEYTTLATHSWTQEGIVGYVFPSAVIGSTPLYRLSYPYATNVHLWTTDANENTTLATQYGWTSEGITGFVFSTPSTLLAPTGLTATVAGANINLAWTNPNANATGFCILRSLDPAGNFSLVGTVSSAATTTWTDTLANAGITYYYQVRADNAFVMSAVSNTAFATVPTGGFTGYVAKAATFGNTVIADSAADPGNPALSLLLDQTNAGGWD